MKAPVRGGGGSRVTVPNYPTPTPLLGSPRAPSTKLRRFARVCCICTLFGHSGLLCQARPIGILCAEIAE